MAACVVPVAQSQETPNDASTVAPVWRTDVTGSFLQKDPLLKLVPGGQAKNIRLTGINNTQYLDFGVRADELVSGATLDLAFTASPALIPEKCPRLLSIHARFC